MLTKPTVAAGSYGFLMLIFAAITSVEQAECEPQGPSFVLIDTFYSDRSIDEDGGSRHQPNTGRPLPPCAEVPEGEACCTMSNGTDGCRGSAPNQHDAGWTHFGNYLSGLDGHYKARLYFRIPAGPITSPHNLMRFQVAHTQGTQHSAQVCISAGIGAPPVDMAPCNNANQLVRLPRSQDFTYELEFAARPALEFEPRVEWLGNNNLLIDKIELYERTE